MRDVDKPQPRADEVLVRIHASNASPVGLAPTGLSFVEVAAIEIGGLLASLAKHLGAEVTAVCGTENPELVAASARTPCWITRRRTRLLGERATTGCWTPWLKHKTSALRTACVHALRPQVHVLSVDDGSPELSASNLAELEGLAERGALKRVIDRRYPLEQIAEAHRYLEQEHKRRNLVVSIIPDGAE